MLIGHSNIKKRDTVVEIGAGSGVITYALAKKCARVLAFEPDAKTAQKLRENLAKRNVENVEIFEQDFLTFELGEELGEYKVFANPPFSLSSAIVHKFLSAKNPPKSFYLILQKQFALKLLNTSRHYTSQLGRELICYYAAKIKYPLRSTDFTPPPAVPTVLFEAKRIAS